MKKLLSTALMAGSLLFAGVAQAQPTSFPYTIYGEVTVQKGTGPVLTCDVAVTFDYVSPPTPAKKMVTDIQLIPGHPYCETVQFPDSPWEIDYDVITHNFTIKNLRADTTVTPGDCFGDLSAIWNGTSYDINGTLPEVTSGTGDCAIIGYLNV